MMHDQSFKSWGFLPDIRVCAVVFAVFLLPCQTTSGQAPAQTTPGPEHELIASLVGEWDFLVGNETVGKANAHLRLGDRFLEIEFRLDWNPVQHGIYIFGFDRRHSEYTVIAFDNTGTYWVSAKGKEEDGRIKMYGSDNDPVMTAMGFEKEFVIVLDVPSENRVSIETYYIDTRTPERSEMLGLSYQLHRLTN